MLTIPIELTILEHGLNGGAVAAPHSSKLSQARGCDAGEGLPSSE